MRYFQSKDIKIPEEIVEKWQNIVNVMAEIMKVPAGLIMKVDSPYIEVFKSSQNEDNPYKAGDKDHLSGLYCEKVISSGEKLLVPHAQSDEEWRDNPDIELGMVSYLGFPLKWPDGEVFGTICVLDSKENRYSKKLENVMKQYQELVETHLILIYQNNVRETIYNNIEQGICLHEIVYQDNKAVDYRIVDANLAFEKILNIPLKKAKGILATKLYNTEKAPFLERYVRASVTGQPVTFEEYFPPMNKYFHITVTSSGKGKFITLFHDITRSKLMEQKIKENAKRLSITLNSIGDAVIATNKLGQIIEMNIVAEKLTGWGIENARGKKLAEVFKIINSKTRKSMGNPVKKVLGTGRILGLANHTILIAKDGTEYQIADSASPIMDEEKNILGVVLIFRDVTEKYEKEQKIKESEEKYRTLVTSAPIGIFKTTSTGEPLSVNQTMIDILGCKNIEEVLRKYKNIGKDLYSNLERRKSFINKLTRDGEVKNFQYKAKRADGKSIWLSTNARVSERLEDGSVIIDGFTTDITESKKISDELYDKEKEMSAIYQNTPILMMVLDKERRVRKVNKSVSEYTGIPTEKMIGKRSGEVFRCLNSLEDLNGSYCEQCMMRKTVLDTINTGQSHHYIEVTLPIIKEGIDHNEKMTFLLFTTLMYIKKEPLVLVNILDITQRKKFESKMVYLSYHDNLTGLYNRTFLEEEIQRLDVKRQLPISLIMADLNGLKIINDSYGHQKGDEILIKTSEILKKACREEDIVSRWGGDEFVILLPQTDLKEAQKIQSRIESLARKSQSKIPISIAVGINVKKNVEEDIYEILNKAEDKMYQDKLVDSRSAKSGILKALLSTLGEKSHETEEHAWRLQKWALAIGEKINLTHAELDRLSIVATLHDIEKIVIPGEILNKPGVLTGEEWQIVKEHPATGYRITSSTEEFAHVAVEILNHHERWDGTGYPREKKEKEIPLLARIITIVDAYDVMTYGRPYKKPMAREEALNEIRRCAGSQFDPELVDVFIDIH